MHEFVESVIKMREDIMRFDDPFPPFSRKGTFLSCASDSDSDSGTSDGGIDFYPGPITVEDFDSSFVAFPFM